MGAKGVRFQDITKIFFTGNNQQVKAVDSLSLNIAPGEFVCLLGPSGCGKTTMLRMLAGFETPTYGHIYIGDENVERVTPDKRDTAMVFQNYALFPHMNVYDNIAYGLKLQKLPKDQVDKRVNRILKMMKMENFAQRVPSQMSGGQQQRVSLARALVMEPGVLLFDEPLSNLDAKLRIHMRDEIRRLQQEVGITSIYVTHDQAEAMGLSDKIVIMKDGLIQQIGSPMEVYQKPANEFVANFIGKANIFEGKILAETESSYSVNIHGAEYEIPKSSSHSAHEIGDEVRLMVRPESIAVDQKDFSGEVVKSMFMGSHHEYEVMLEDKKIEISINNPVISQMKKKGETLGFAFQEQSVHMF